VQSSASVPVEPYDTKTAMTGLFLEESQFDEMLDALKENKNVVLQGAPGVGKTFVAKRLAYALVSVLPGSCCCCQLRDGRPLRR
jgi:MoxR-like ATPase